MSNSKIENIYQLDGRVPLMKAVPFGVQHVLAMFVANLAPIMIIAGAAGLSKEATGMLLQNAMFERYVYCRYCHSDSAVSCMEDWC